MTPAMLKNFDCMNVLGELRMDEVVTIVSGLPRSGTSMMMRMLMLGGVPALTDGIRARDAYNPHGYFEFEQVKDPANYPRWMNQAQGCAVKLVSRLIPHLPSTHRYRIIFMHRAIEDVLSSQRKMALHYSGTDWQSKTLDELKRTYSSDIALCLRWARQRPNIDLLEVRYEEVLERPNRQIERLAHFLAPRPIDLHSMRAAIDHKLNNGCPAKEEHSA